MWPFNKKPKYIFKIKYNFSQFPTLATTTTYISANDESEAAKKLRKQESGFVINIIDIEKRVKE